MHPAAGDSRQRGFGPRKEGRNRQQQEDGDNGSDQHDLRDLEGRENHNLFLGLMSRFRNSYTADIGRERISESKDISKLLNPSVVMVSRFAYSLISRRGELRNHDTRPGHP